MKINIALKNEGGAVLESGEIQDLGDALKFLLTALHVEGFSYVHNLIALKDGGGSVSATGELYKIKQVWKKYDDFSVLVEASKLTELMNDVAYYENQAEQYKAIRNRMAVEINELLSKLDMPAKYDIFPEENL